jgi:hypothetical protein
LRSGLRCFVQAVAEPAHDFYVVNSAAGGMRSWPDAVKLGISRIQAEARWSEAHTALIITRQMSLSGVWRKLIKA